MKDFTEQEACSTSPLKLSQDTPTVSDNLPDTDEEFVTLILNGPIDTLADPELTAQTITKLAPYREALINKQENTN